MGAAAEFGAGDAGGEAEIVFDARTGAGLPAGRQWFDDEGAQALAGAVDAGGEARRTGADHDQVVEFLSGLNAEADAAGEHFQVRVDERRAVGKDQHGKFRGIELAILEKFGGFRAGGDVEPAVGHVIAREKVAHAEVGERPARADDAQALEDRHVARLPILEQIVEDGIELFFRRIPGLVEVIVDARGIDGANGRLGVGIGGEEHAACVRIDVARPLQQFARRSCPACAGR